MGRYDSDRANRPDRLATVYGAMLAVDTRPQAETKNKYIAHWNAINKMIRESGKAVAQVRYSGHKIVNFFFTFFQIQISKIYIQKSFSWR